MHKIVTQRLPSSIVAEPTALVQVFFTRTVTSLASLATLTLLAVAGCGSDDGSDTPMSEWEKYDVPEIDAGPIPDPFRYDQVPDPWPAETPEACKAFTSAETATNPYPDFRNCACDTCLDWMHQCDALQSCREIRQCGLDIGCDSPNACYLAPAPSARDPEGKGCVAVIDRWGNIGLGTYVSRKLQECAVNCPRPE